MISGHSYILVLQGIANLDHLESLELFLQFQFELGCSQRAIKEYDDISFIAESSSPSLLEPIRHYLLLNPVCLHSQRILVNID